MSLIGIKNEISNNDLKIIPVKGLPIKSNWSLIWHKGKILTEVAQAYDNYVKLDTCNIISKPFNWYNNF